MAFSLDQFSLAGKVAIVTGAGGRKHSIGEAYCLGRAAAGATVVAADINEAGAKSVAEMLVAQGHQAIGVAVDITCEASVAELAATVEKTYGGADTARKPRASRLYEWAALGVVKRPAGVRVFDRVGLAVGHAAQAQPRNFET